jgi:hypothetical protein
MNDGMEQNLEGSGLVLVDIITKNFPGGTEGSYEKASIKIIGVAAEIRTEDFVILSLELYRYVNLIVVNATV